MPTTRPAPFRFGIVMTGESVFGRNLSFDECRDALKTMNFLHVAIRLVMLLRYNDEKIMSGEVADAERDMRISRMLGTFLDDGMLLRRALGEWELIRSSGQQYRPFSSQAILALLEFAGAHCPRSGGGNVENAPYRLQLTHILLSIQTELVSRVGLKQLVSVASVAEGSEVIHTELVRNRMAHNAEWYTRNAMARIYALGFVPEIGSSLPSGFSPATFFQNRLGLDPGQYLVAALLTGMFHGSFDPDAPSFSATAVKPEDLFAHIQPSLRERMREYICLASQSAEKLGEGIVGAKTLSELIYMATSFYVRPILAFEGFSVCTSSIHLKNKFLVEIVHLVQDRRRAVDGGALSTEFVKAVGGEFGALFEAYLRWLFNAWFGSWPRTRLHFGYKIPSTGHGGKDSERDLLVVRSDTAFLFEVKSKPAPLALRHSGAHEDLDRVFLPGSLQARSAAEALRAGRAMTRSGARIEGIRYVIPCVIVWDFVPMAGTLSASYERHLENLVGPSTFRESDGIAPLQFLSLQDVEAWERNCDLTPESGDLFGFLVRRSREEGLRHSPMEQDHFRGVKPGQPSPLDDMAAESLRYVKKETWQYLIVPPPQDGAPEKQV